MRYVRALAEYGRLPLRILHTDSSCRWANRHWLRSTGRKLDQVLGSGWLEDVHPEDRERCSEVWQTVSNEDTAGQAFRQVEYRLRHANGEFAWVLELGTPRFTSQGSLGGFLGAVRDTPCVASGLVHLLLMFAILLVPGFIAADSGAVPAPSHRTRPQHVPRRSTSPVQHRRLARRLGFDQIEAGSRFDPVSLQAGILRFVNEREARHERMRELLEGRGRAGGRRAYLPM